MIITNKHALPDIFVKVVANDEYSRGDARCSATDLLKSPRMFWLTERHREEIETDVVDNIWQILGSAPHYILKMAESKETLQEERMNCEINGWKISGQIDFYDGANLIDFKVTSAYSVVYESRHQDWADQLNIYAWFLHKYGFKVERVANILILRDHSRMKAKTDSSYPQVPIHVLEHSLEPMEDVEAGIRGKVEQFKSFESTPDDELPCCSEEDRWHRSDKWALMKKGRKSAVKVCDTEEEANKMVGFKGSDSIVHRPGEDVRCADFCNVNKFCVHYKGE